MPFCQNCGTEIATSTRFCPVCGTPSGSTQPPEIALQQTDCTSSVERCPNCGGIRNGNSMVCDFCGYTFKESSSQSFMEKFQAQLMSIEQASSGIFAKGKSTSHKISLIQTYPLPGTPEELLEFMSLAVSNIDVAKTRKYGMNPHVDSYTSAGKISIAWFGKMQQIYQKAQMSFPNSEAFGYIQKLYFDEMKKLHYKV